MKIDPREPTYLFDEAIADRLRRLAYNFQAAIDELLARTRVEPLEVGDVGFEELGFWEARADLTNKLSRSADDF